LREQQKISQEEAAERCGLHRTYYSCRAVLNK
jgi:transcriptional regulator with XRE-family HTH domain